MIIPLEHLSEEIIDNLIKEYCLRDWGCNETESPLASRYQGVKSALDKGELVVLFSEAHQTAQLVEANKLTPYDESHSSDNTTTEQADFVQDRSAQDDSTQNSIEDEAFNQDRGWD